MNGSITKPLWMPLGSVRAIVTLLFAITVVVVACLGAKGILEMILPIATYTIGQYFGTRSNFDTEKK